MRSLVAILALALLACGDATPEPSVPPSSSAPSSSSPSLPSSSPPSSPPSSPSSFPSSSAPSSSRECTRPWSGGADDPKFNPKPLDAAKLAIAERGAMSALEKDYARARAHFEAQMWPEAARELRAIAIDHPDDDVGIYAGQLYLESVNMLGTHARRPECFDDLTSDVPIFASLYCGTRRPHNEEACVLLEKIQFDIDRLRVQKLVERGDRDGDREAFRAGAEGYEAILRAHCMPASQGDHCDEVAYNAAMAFRAAHDDASAERVLAIMRDPKNRMQTSALTAKLARILAHVEFGAPKE